ncbi:MAG: hypothetical protein EKK64_00610 [Neisseriaceae bacterium]|nr:MAG: hypothetical protein EKK64_00610 [Neisseriaceae bacterium]
MSFSLEQQREILKLISENSSLEVETEDSSDYGNRYKSVTVKLTIHDPETAESIGILTDYFSIDLD